MTRRTRTTQHPLYSRWAGIKQTVLNPRNADYPRIGGAGIKLAPDFYDFKQFASLIETTIGIPPAIDYTCKLARKDPQGDFEPGNMFWSTSTEVARIQPKAVKFSYQGTTQCIKAWAEQYGISRATLHDRIKMGWTMAQALETPIWGMRSGKLLNSQ